MNINLEFYKIFYHVAKNKNISRTAKELLISQPAISKTIKILEDQINTKLFIRKRDGVELTDAGEILYTKVKDAIDLIYSAESDLASLTNMEQGSINIGSNKTIVHEFLMPYIKQFHLKYPKINIRIFTDKVEDLIKKAKIGLIDIIFANLPYNIPTDFQEFKLMDLHDCLVANDTFIEYKDKKLKIEDLEKLPLLILSKGFITRIRLDNYCLKNNININPEMEFSSNSLIKDFTKAGFGIGLLTEEHIKKELEKGELFKLNFKLSLENKYLGMIWDPNNKSSVCKNFIRNIKDNINK